MLVKAYEKVSFIYKSEVWLLGTCGGARRRLLTLRKSLQSHVSSRSAMEKVNLKLIDTTSKKGKGRFQTTAEKKAYFGPTKREKTVVVSAGAGGDKSG